MIARVDLERRIADERMHELQPHGELPEWAWQFGTDQPRVWTLDINGVASKSWQWLDAVSWHDVAAVRMEYAHGQPIDPADMESEDWAW